MLHFEPFTIIDISQPIAPDTACFPGDVPFSAKTTLSVAGSDVINLTAFTMSPHVGTHADAPSHITGDVSTPVPHAPNIGQLPLSPFIGACRVVDLSPFGDAITLEALEAIGALQAPLPPRMLFKTRTVIGHDVFEPDYAWIDESLVSLLSEQKVILVGLDTPSVDAVDSKTLDTHHQLLDHQLTWLENLDFTALDSDPVFQKQRWADYWLLALPLKFMTLEASPVRAVLLKFHT